MDKSVNLLFPKQMEKTKAKWDFDNIAILIAGSEHMPNGPTPVEASIARVLANHVRVMEEEGKTEEEITAFLEEEAKKYQSLEG